MIEKIVLLLHLKVEKRKQISIHISKLVLHDLLKGKGMQLQSLETGAVEEKPF